MGFISIGNAREFGEGTPRAIDVDGRSIAVVNAGGRWYAFDDTCTHQRCSLSDGEVEGSAIVCPCHGGTFDMTTGAVLAGPPPEPVETYVVELDGNEVRIGRPDRAA